MTAVARGARADLAAVVWHRPAAGPGARRASSAGPTSGQYSRQLLEPLGSPSAGCLPAAQRSADASRPSSTGSRALQQAAGECPPASHAALDISLPLLPRSALPSGRRREGLLPHCSPVASASPPVQRGCSQTAFGSAPDGEVEQDADWLELLHDIETLDGVLSEHELDLQQIASRGVALRELFVASQDEASELAHRVQCVEQQRTDAVVDTATLDWQHALETTASHWCSHLSGVGSFAGEDDVLHVPPVHQLCADTFGIVGHLSRVHDSAASNGDACADASFATLKRALGLSDAG